MGVTIMEQTVTSRTDKGAYILETVAVSDGGHNFVMQCARGKKDGGYIGDESEAEYLVGWGIEPERIDEESSVCSVGFRAEDRKWFGWSHRAIAGFGIGDKLYEEQFGDDDTLPRQHGSVTIETIEQARQAAVNFARSVS